MARVTEQRHGALRTAILDAAEQVIAGQGLGQLGMRHLAERAGCSLGMLYKLFADGDEVVLRVNARTLDAITDAMRRAAGAVPDRNEKLRAMALAYLNYAQAHRLRWDALFVHRMAGGAPVPDWYGAERARGFDVLLSLVPGPPGRAAQELEQEWAQTLFSALHGVVLLGLEEKLGTLSASALRARVLATVDALSSGLAAPGSAQAG